VLFGDDNLSLSDEVRLADGISGSVFSSVGNVNIIMAFIIELAIIFPSLFPLVFLVSSEAVGSGSEVACGDSAESGGLEGTGGSGVVDSS